MSRGCGSSALAGGAIAAGNSNLQKRSGTKNVSDDGFAKIWIKDQERSFHGGDEAMPDEKRIHKAVREFDKTVNWMEDTIGYKFAFFIQICFESLNDKATAGRT